MLRVFKAQPASFSFNVLQFTGPHLLCATINTIYYLLFSHFSLKTIFPYAQVNQSIDTLYIIRLMCVLLLFQPERIDPPDPTKPDYDIRADVWSLGISLVSRSHI